MAATAALTTDTEQMVAAVIHPSNVHVCMHSVYILYRRSCQRVSARAPTQHTSIIAKRDISAIVQYCHCLYRYVFGDGVRHRVYRSSTFT